VSQLVLCVTAAHSGFIARAKQIVAARGTLEQQASLGRLWAGEIDSVDKLRRYYDVMGPLYALKYNAVEAQASRERGIMNPEALNRAFGPVGFMHSYDLRPELKNITAPTLIIAGRHDWICAPEFSEEIHRLIPGSDLRIFENSSHSLRVDEPERLIETIDGFLFG
jgi:proline iminopeptidase